MQHLVLFTPTFLNRLLLSLTVADDLLKDALIALINRYNYSLQLLVAVTEFVLVLRPQESKLTLSVFIQLRQQDLHGLRLRLEVFKGDNIVD